MSFDSDDDARESRIAVAALMGLATREYILNGSTDHHDYSRAVAGKAPLAPMRDGAMGAAPDVLLINPRLGLIYGVEVEVRPYAHHYPTATFCGVAKLRGGVEIEVTHPVYARAIRGEDYDLASNWGQRCIRALVREHAAGRLDFFKTSRSVLLYPRDLRDLHELFRRVREGV